MPLTYTATSRTKLPASALPLQARNRRFSRYARPTAHSGSFDLSPRLTLRNSYFHFLTSSVSPIQCVSRQQGRLLLLSAGWRLPSVVVQAALHSQRRCSNCILRQVFGAHYSASPRASLAAGSGTDNIPSLRSDTPLPQRISAGIPRREHSSDSRRGKTPSSTVVYNNNARSAGAEIYPR